MIEFGESAVEITLAHGGYIIALRGLVTETELNGVPVEQSDECLHVALTLESAMAIAERHIRAIEAEWAESVDAESCDEPPPDERAEAAR